MKKPRTIHINTIYDHIPGKEFGNLIENLPVYFLTLLKNGDTSILEEMNPDMKLLFETINRMFQIRFGKSIEEKLSE